MRTYKISMVNNSVYLFKTDETSIDVMIRVTEKTWLNVGWVDSKDIWIKCDKIVSIEAINEVVDYEKF